MLIPKKRSPTAMVLCVCVGVVFGRGVSKAKLRAKKKKKRKKKCESSSLFVLGPPHPKIFNRHFFFFLFGRNEMTNGCPTAVNLLWKHKIIVLLTIETMLYFTMKGLFPSFFGRQFIFFLCQIDMKGRISRLLGQRGERGESAVQVGYLWYAVYKKKIKYMLFFWNEKVERKKEKKPMNAEKEKKR
jgi:hypothetical protein